jgi:hypothetical protein
MSRNALLSVVGGFLIAALIVSGSSPPAAVALLAAGAASGLWYFARHRSGAVRFFISTECERCGALLQEHLGLPERACRTCGHPQSWANAREP